VGIFDVGLKKEEVVAETKDFKYCSRRAQMVVESKRSARSNLLAGHSSDQGPSGVNHQKSICPLSKIEH